MSVFGDFSGTWVVQKYSVLQSIYFVFLKQCVLPTVHKRTRCVLLLLIMIIIVVIVIDLTVVIHVSILNTTNTGEHRRKPVETPSGAGSFDSVPCLSGS